MSEETTSPEEATEEASDHEKTVPMAELRPPEPDVDENVEAQWSVAVLPGESASIHFRVTPRADTSAVRSVTASFVASVHGMIEHTYAGSTMNDTMEPRPGQGLTGDTGVDLVVFEGRVPENARLEAILAGVVVTEDGPTNFLFTRSFELPSDDD